MDLHNLVPYSTFRPLIPGIGEQYQAVGSIIWLRHGFMFGSGTNVIALSLPWMNKLQVLEVQASEPWKTPASNRKHGPHHCTAAPCS